MSKELEIMEVLNAASRGRQLNSLLQNIFERGTDNCTADDELVGLAYDISSKVCHFLDQLEEQENK